MARLETDVLEFRSPELRLSIPFRQMKNVTSRGQTLFVTFALGAASFDLGRAAAKWADRIRPTTDAQRLTACWRKSSKSRYSLEDRQGYLGPGQFPGSRD
jgi:hypothetical protein